MTAHVPPGRGRGLPGLIIDLIYLAALDRERAERAGREREAQEPDELVTTAKGYLEEFDWDVLDEADFVFAERHGDYHAFEKRSRAEAESRYRKICQMLQAEKDGYGRIKTRGMVKTRYRDAVLSRVGAQAPQCQHGSRKTRFCDLTFADIVPRPAREYQAHGPYDQGGLLSWTIFGDLLQAKIWYPQFSIKLDTTGKSGSQEKAMWRRYAIFTKDPPWLKWKTGYDIRGRYDDLRQVPVCDIDCVDIIEGLSIVKRLWRGGEAGAEEHRKIWEKRSA